MHLRLTMALRFMRSRRKGALTRFISFASTSGIALGVFAAIVGFSAMNGFEYELENRVLSIIPSAQLNSGHEYFKDASAIEKVLAQDSRIVSSAAAIEKKAILVANQTFLPVNLLGIDPIAESRVVALQNFMDEPLSVLTPKDANQPKSQSPNIQPATKTNDISADMGVNAQAQAQAQAQAEVETEGNGQGKADNKTEGKAGIESALALREPQHDITQSGLEHVPNEVRESILYAQSVEKKVLSHDKPLPNIVLGAALARKLGVEEGDTIEVFTLNLSPIAHDKAPDGALNLEYGKLKQVLQAPQKIRARVVGLLRIGGQLDSVIALMHIQQLEEILGLPGPNTIHIRTHDLGNTQRIVVEATSGKITENAYLTTWLSTYGKLYHDIQMIRQIMFLAMFLVLAVACFNIISNLMMMVGEKRREIAILLTMGMTPGKVITTFSLMGLLSGGYGALIGVVLGVPFSLLISPITANFKSWFGFDLLNPDVYFINFIPCRLDWVDLVIIIAAALCMSLCAALYPAYRAAHVKPAQELNL